MNIARKNFSTGLAGLFIFLFAAGSALAAETTVTVTNVTARQRFPWNGLVDIECVVEGIEGEAAGVKFAVAAVEESGKTHRARHVRMVRDGEETDDLAPQGNGTHRLVWDARADLGPVVLENVTIRVTFDAHAKVQLWEGGPLWAETNVGAEEPEEYGLYFWWGDTVGYMREGSAWVASDGSSESFSFGSSTTPTYGKSYATLQSEGWITAEGVLAPEHDAAQAHWGGDWRMPTYQELYDLCYNKCDWTWTTQNGVNGYVVRGRGDYSEASIFLPAAGYGNGPSLYDAVSHGYYWSSVPYSGDSRHAHGLYFNSGYHYTRYNRRYYGQSVRPVQGFAQ